MTKTELLALAERLDSTGAGDNMRAAVVLRKLAALEPVAWAYEEERFGRVLTRTTFDDPVVPLFNLYNLTGIIDHE